ncbi:MAG: DUF1501 domain-containing protein [Pseudomonadota bacterium]
MISRRQFLLSTAAASLAMSAPGLALAGSAPGRPRLLVVILRGGMDGLAALPPYGDRAYTRTRGDLALPAPGEENGILDLDGFFGLHPRLAGLHALYRGGELIAFAGTAPPYRERSHFDAQNVLESGVEVPHAARDGWLYRALAGAPGSGDLEHLAMAVGQSVPLILRGERSVGSWAPDGLPDPDDDTMARVLRLYQEDGKLGPRVAAMMATEDMMGDMEMTGRGRGSNLAALASRAAEFLVHENGPQVAVLESGGWDTHANQGSAGGNLANRLGALDEVLGELKAKLGGAWRQTAVLVVTEFGRTVVMNGTRGTDHGVGGAAFLLGGAVSGGRVVADWAGLAKNQLLEGRDVQPTIDQRSIFKAVLTDHLGLPLDLVNRRVFPSSTGVQPQRKLFA